MDLVCAGESVGAGGCVPVCGISVRPYGKTICSYTGRELDNPGHDCSKYSAQHERVHWSVKVQMERVPLILTCSLAGMAIAGAGAGINELTALAVTSELAPTRKRGKYVAILVFSIIPFCPSVLWAQLIASHSSWRNCGAFCGAWAAAGLIMTAIFYFPPPRVNSKGLTRWEVVKQIDFVGGLLSVTGMIIFNAGLQWGGYQVCHPDLKGHALTDAD